MKKKIPSKSSNYASLIEENAYYVDKTKYLTTLESISDKYLFFLRPRRFGKSLTLSMLEYYYGIQHKDKFEQLFGQYFIGQTENVTPLRNKYMMLRFDFSGVETQNEKEIRGSFNNKISKGISEFISNYGGFDRSLIYEFERGLSPADYILHSTTNSTIWRVLLNQSLRGCC